MYREILVMLEGQQSRGRHHIVTLDASWFYLRTDHERIWLAADEPVPDRERHMSEGPALMITVVCHRRGFHVVRALPKEPKFNAGDDAREIFQEIKNWRERQGVGIAQQSSMHADSARPHPAQL
jgi:hypothetical protein